MEAQFKSPMTDKHQNHRYYNQVKDLPWYCLKMNDLKHVLGKKKKEAVCY